MTYQKFYHRIGKDPIEMDIDELRDEIEACRQWEQDCIRIGQGINTKETMRDRNLRDEVRRRLVASTISVDTAFELAGV